MGLDRVLSDHFNHVYTNYTFIENMIHNARTYKIKRAEIKPDSQQLATFLRQHLADHSSYKQQTKSH